MPSGEGRYGFAIAGLIVAGTVGLAAATFAVLRPPQPQFSAQRSEQKINTQQLRAEPGCDTEKLSKIGSVRQRRVEMKRCGDAAERKRVEQAKLDELRTIEAAEESARQTFYQGQSSALQSSLGVLVLGASAWAAWAAYRAAHYAKLAATHTEEGVRATKSGIDQAHENAKRELRAYVAIAKVGVMWTKAGAPLFRFELKNSGQTPAVRVAVGASAIVPASREGWGQAPHPAMVFTEMGGIAGGDTDWDHLPVTGDEGLTSAKMTESEAKLLVLKACVRFTDVFGEVWEYSSLNFFDANFGTEGELSRTWGKGPLFRKVDSMVG